MADALGAENFDRLTHGVRAADFAGVNEPMQSFRGGVVVYLTKFCCWASEFVPAHAKRDYALVAKPHGALGDFARRNGQTGAPCRRSTGDAGRAVRMVRQLADGAEIRFDILFAQEHHARPRASPPA